MAMHVPGAAEIVRRFACEDVVAYGSAVLDAETAAAYAQGVREAHAQLGAAFSDFARSLPPVSRA